MKNSLSQRAARFYQNRRRKQLWCRAVSAMACVVVFCLSSLIKKMDRYFCKPTSVINRVMSALTLS